MKQLATPEEVKRIFDTCVKDSEEGSEFADFHMSFADIVAMEERTRRLALMCDRKWRATC